VALLYLYRLRHGGLDEEAAARDLCRTLQDIRGAEEKLRRMGLTQGETPAPEAAEENTESPITPPISEETVETDYTVGGLSGAEAPDDFVAYEDGEPDDGESGEDDVSSFEPITVDSAETMIPTMEESELIGRLTDNTGYEPPRFVYNNVLNAINKWNALNEAQRHELLSGTARNADLEYLLMANLIKLPSEVNEDMEMAA
jgi:hypothetical protein